MTNTTIRPGAAENPGTGRRPPENLLATMHRTGHFKHLMAAVRATGLATTLDAAGPYTLFAPNDYAFGKLPNNVLTDLLKPENTARLTAILKLHVVSGHVMSAVAGEAPTSLRSLQGEELAINTAQGLRVSNARIVERDMEASNGVIHAIDTVLIPAES